MAPPKKRPPQKRPAGKKPPQARKPAGAASRAGAAKAASAAGAGADTTASDAAEGSAAGASPAQLSKSAEEKKLKREAARQERVAAAKKRQQAKRRKQILLSIVLLVALGAAVFYGIQRSKGEKAAFAAAADEAGCGDIESFPDEMQGKPHLAADASFDGYKTNPPTSGVHRGQTSPWGSYREAPDHENLVHNLEHGGVIINYKDLSDERIDELDAFADSFVDGVVSIPNPEIEKPIALASWRNMQQCDELNTKAIEGFIAERCNKGPEKLGITCNRE